VHGDDVHACGNLPRDCFCDSALIIAFLANGHGKFIWDVMTSSPFFFFLLLLLVLNWKDAPETAEGDFIVISDPATSKKVLLLLAGGSPPSVHDMGKSSSEKKKFIRMRHYDFHALAHD
jgi:hypothetical protein